jgi:hypothetical protein
MPKISEFFGIHIEIRFLDLHRDELMVAWQQAANGKDPEPIEPLK